MSGQKLIRVFNAGALLLILLAAYAGKSLHTHPDEYYRYLKENDANTGSCGRLCDLPFPFLLVYPFYRLGP